MIFIYTTGCGHFLYRVDSVNKDHFLTNTSVSALPVAFRHLLPPPDQDRNADFHLSKQKLVIFYTVLTVSTKLIF
ncbi:hypothetical protein D1D72_00505 [Salmonella enterica]|nr:hypothetical protein [Salmonella enterica]